MQTISDFLAMGGHAGFIWPAFIVSVGLLAVLWFVSARGFKGSEKILEDLDKKGAER